MTKTQVGRCTFDEKRDGKKCDRTLVGGLFCAVHDRVSCSAPVIRRVIPQPERCGARLIDGAAERCPECGRSVRLNDVLKGGI